MILVVVIFFVFFILSFLFLWVVAVILLLLFHHPFSIHLQIILNLIFVPQTNQKPFHLIFLIIFHLFFSRSRSNILFRSCSPRSQFLLIILILFNFQKIQVEMDHNVWWCDFVNGNSKNWCGCKNWPDCLSESQWWLYFSVRCSCCHTQLFVAFAFMEWGLMLGHWYNKWLIN